ncbi:MAG TPA: hypothetical protein VGG89_01430 [Candidatus Baltobacteraceae bacterium]
MQRAYVLYVPEHRAARMPLVLVFHGGGGAGRRGRPARPISVILLTAGT